ncbi:transcription factor HES-4-like isoform 2-T2 [Callospermophilus lateralis]|uniref:transcription factor HES-4-like isoform X2 n=1 Tax=Callospermophilus lateralis TaxID=76772 RepID=UPI004053ABAC
MSVDTPEKPSASPLAGAQASASPTPDKPRSAAEHRKSSRHSKLEKADILEMTVIHLQNLRRFQVTAALSSDPAVLGKYCAGFNECLAEVTRFLAGCEGVPAKVPSRLLGHLAACLLQLGSSHRSASLPAAADKPESEVYAGRPPQRSFDGPFPLLRPGAAFAPLLPPRLTLAPPAAPRMGSQGRSGPWRP